MNQAIIKLWVNSIINKKKNFQEVPEGLKEIVKKNLIAAGRQDLLKD